jgi:hypothetical protein
VPASIDLTSVRPSDLTDDIISRHLGETFTTEGWTVDQFVNLPMGARWCATCTCCDRPVASCKNNLSLGWGALKWTEWYGTRAKVVEAKPVIVKAAPGETPTEVGVMQVVKHDDAAMPVSVAKTGERGEDGFLRDKRGRILTEPLRPDQYEECLAFYDGGATRNACKFKFNTDFQWMTDFLKANGRHVGRGKRPPVVQEKQLALV